MGFIFVGCLLVKASVRLTCIRQSKCLSSSLCNKATLYFIVLRAMPNFERNAQDLEKRLHLET